MFSIPNLVSSFIGFQGFRKSFRAGGFRFSGSRARQGATTFLDEGDNGNGLLVPGRKTRELTLDGMLEGESGYLMLQVFAVTGKEVILCSERLLAVRPAFVEPTVTLSSADPTLNTASLRELALEAHINVPAEISVSI